MYYTTYRGLHKWCEHVFEHLGWMLLAKNRGHSIKVKAYLEGLEHLHRALEEAIMEYEEKDRQRDLKVLLHNVKILEKYAKKVLKKSKKSSRK